MNLRKRNSFARLRQFASEKPQSRSMSQCELCGLEIPAVRHRHLLELATRQVVCACDPCAFRFHDVVGGKFKLIPRDTRRLPDFEMTDGQWDGLAIPINLAFFFHSASEEKLVAMYPSPAGATESLLSLREWETLLANNPILAEMEVDVEALLVNRVGEARDYFLAPIDTCYRLVGLIRTHWRGLSGGKVIWDEIEQFFVELNEKSPAARQRR
jgi:hypothetical protein